MAMPIPTTVVSVPLAHHVDLDTLTTVLLLVLSAGIRVVSLAAQVSRVTMAATPPTQLCRAPKILSAAPCRQRVAAPGARACSRQLGTDPEPRCQGVARNPQGL